MSECRVDAPGMQTVAETVRACGRFHDDITLFGPLVKIVENGWRIYSDSCWRNNCSGVIGGAEGNDMALVICHAHQLRRMIDKLGWEMQKNIYMIIEKFRNGDAIPVYRRFRDKGRLAPEGLTYLSSWVNESITCCYQVMETHDRKLLDQWVENWKDIVDFEIHTVITSKDAADKMLPLL